MTAAVRTLEAGGLVVFPTETVWGLGCRLDRPRAIERIFTLKGRDPDKPLQVLLGDPSMLGEVAVDVQRAEPLAHLMPGPLTVVLPARDDLPDLGGGPGTVGVRVPDHPAALRIVREAGPTAATSANRSGEPTPITLEAVRAIFGDEVGAYVDAGPGPAGVPSSVLDLTGEVPILLREGAVAAADLEAALGRSVGHA